MDMATAHEQADRGCQDSLLRMRFCLRMRPADALPMACLPSPSLPPVCQAVPMVYLTAPHHLRVRLQPTCCVSVRPSQCVSDSSAPMAGLMSVYNFGRNFDFAPDIKSETLLCPIFCQLLMRRTLYPEILHKIMPKCAFSRTLTSININSRNGKSRCYGLRKNFAFVSKLP